MTHSAGVVRAAQRLICHTFNMNVLKEIIPSERIAEIIDEETYNSEMLAFIEEFVKWDIWVLLPPDVQEAFTDKQAEMKELIQKVRSG